MGGELPARVAGLHALHEAVAGDLGDHGGGGDGGRGSIAADDVGVGFEKPVGGTGKPSEGADFPAVDADAGRVSLSAARLVWCRPRASMPRTQREVTEDLDGGPQDAG